jgi:hypothetical protein
LERCSWLPPASRQDIMAISLQAELLLDQSKTPIRLALRRDPSLLS